MRPATWPRSSATALTAPALARVSSVAASTRPTSLAVSPVRVRGDLDAARDFLRRRALLGDGGGDGAADVADLADGVLNRRDCLDRTNGRALHAGDLRADFFGGAPGLPGQRLHFSGNHRKAAAGFARARSFDGGVESQQIGLRGDVGDELDDVADAGSGFVELLDRQLVRSASTTALTAMQLDCATWRSISITETDNSSAADAMSRTLAKLPRRRPPRARSWQWRRRRHRQVAWTPSASGRRCGRVRRALLRLRRRSA